MNYCDGRRGQRIEAAQKGGQQGIVVGRIVNAISPMGVAHG